MTKHLSREAQAVLGAALAVEDASNTIPMIVAALRAAADQVEIKLGGIGLESAWYFEEIAAELEGTSD